MKKLFFAAVAMIAMLASCTEEPKVPTISDVKYAPDTVLAEQEVTVTATIEGEGEFTATLVYSVDAAEAAEVAMTAVDDVYTGIIPGQEDGAKVSFYVQVNAEQGIFKSNAIEYTVGNGETPEPEPTPGVLMLNELSGVDKFIELYNPGETDIVLDNYYIEKDAKPEPVWVGDGTITVPAGGYVVLWSEDVAQEHGLEEGSNYIFGSGLSSKKTVRIALFTGTFPDGEQIDIFTRGNEEGDPNNWGLTISDVKPQVYARIPDGGDWKLADATPGEPNPAEGEDIPQD